MNRSSHRGWKARLLDPALGLMLVGLSLVVSMSACGPAAQTPPTDAQDVCPLSSATFNGWFATGTVTANGVVNPANSLNTLTPDCGFYQWSEQMFLWLNSPAPATYGGGGGRIFDSPAFFDVSPIQPDGSRIFIPHLARGLLNLSLRAAQVGPRGLPVIVDRSGTLFSIQPPQAGEKPMVRNVSGQLVEIAHVKLGRDRRPILLDAAGKVIQAAPAQKTLPTARAEISLGLLARKFVIDRVPIFLGLSGGLIDVEQGQAEDNGVLMAQNGSLIYYGTSVNDVYAYFATGAKDGGITPAPTQFPTNASDLSKITAFASAHGKSFPDPDALAIEVKTSWIEAAGLPNLNTYITRTATIPTYNRSNPNDWVPNGQKTVQLALVAMHVVGSVAQHPEMVWATFEHVGDTPEATFSYNSTSGTKTVTQNTSGTWLFSATGSSGLFNIMHMQQSGADIVPLSPNTISASDTLRSEPWGKDGTDSASNTEVISMNDHVLGMLASGDVRRNYVMTGATWTIGGQPPGAGNQVGTNKLSNTTMETYQQGTNCFTCHVTNTTAVSHVFGPLKPIF